MKKNLKTLLFSLVLLSATNVFAQNFDASKSAFLGVIGAVQNKKDVIYEFTDYDAEKDISYFTYTWTQETKLLMSVSYTQYKCFLNVTSTQDGENKKLVTSYEDIIFSRTVNADGSEIQGTPRIKGVSYTWVENKTILNRKKVFASVIEIVEKDLYEELNKSDGEIAKSLIKFFSNDINLTYFSTDTIGNLANKYLALSNVPSIVFKLKTEKSELWYNKYLEKILGQPFENTLKIDNVKESDDLNYKYKIACNFMFKYMTKDNMDILIKSLESTYKSNGFSFTTKELRKKAYDMYTTNYHIITVNYYTNNDDVIDMNKGDSVYIKGILKSINALGLLKEISSFDVYED